MTFLLYLLKGEFSMKTKFKAIISASAAAAVLSAGIIVGAATVGKASSGKEAARLAAAELREDSEWIDAFNKALLEGKSPTDPVYAAIQGVAAADDDEIMSVYLQPASAAASGIELTLVHDDSGDNGYNLWSGRFTVDDVSAFDAAFASPESMDCEVYTGTSGELVYKNGYSVNYKELVAYYTILENGSRVPHRVVQKGTGQIPEASYNYTGSGELIEKVYCCYMYRGDSTSALYDVALVHVVDSDYSQTAEYSALPYGNLIGCYTYVDVNGSDASEEM